MSQPEKIVGKTLRATFRSRCDACGSDIHTGDMIIWRREDNSMVHSDCARAATRTTIAGDVSVVDVRMPFGSMVTLMVKWSLASVPAVIILLVLFLIFRMLLTAVAQLLV